MLCKEKSLKKLMNPSDAIDINPADNTIDLVKEKLISIMLVKALILVKVRIIGMGIYHTNTMVVGDGSKEIY